MSDVIIPKHIGFIIDGNRRWAKERNLDTFEGHLAGYETLKNIIEAVFNKGVKYISIYAFSTENWKRSEEEVQKLMSLVLNLFTTDLDLFNDNDIKLQVLGSKERLSDEVIDAINKSEAKTSNNKSATLALCFNYGGQREIVDGVKSIIKSGISPDDITEKTIADNLYYPNIPPVDIVVRTSGEQRLSNFMLWRTAYSEIMFIDKMWPDMVDSDVDVVIEEFNNRARRFGK